MSVKSQIAFNLLSQLESNYLIFRCYISAAKWAKLSILRARDKVLSFLSRREIILEFYERLEALQKSTEHCGLDLTSVQRNKLLLAAWGLEISFSLCRAPSHSSPIFHGLQPSGVDFWIWWPAAGERNCPIQPYTVSLYCWTDFFCPRAYTNCWETTDVSSVNMKVCYQTPPCTFNKICIGPKIEQNTASSFLPCTLDAVSVISAIQRKEVTELSSCPRSTAVQPPLSRLKL